jgi:hypothetical protein
LHGGVPALEGDGEGLGLHVRGGDIPVLRDAPLEIGMQFQFSKIHYLSLVK